MTQPGQLAAGRGDDKVLDSGATEEVRPAACRLTSGQTNLPVVNQSKAVRLSATKGASPAKIHMWQSVTRMT